MAKRKPKFTEPSSVPCVYVTGGMVYVEGNIVRLVHWSALPAVEPGNPDELRIETRLAMTPEVALDLYRDLKNGLKTLKRRGKL